MSILTELKKLTKKKNATVVSQALPDSLDGSGSSVGGNGGVLVIHENRDETYVGDTPKEIKFVLDKTTEEVIAAAMSGCVFVYFAEAYSAWVSFTYNWNETFSELDIDYGENGGLSYAMDEEYPYRIYNDK